MVASVVIDGGDQVTAILTLLLLPVTFKDGRIWRWQAPTARMARERWSGQHLLTVLPALLALTAIRLQVAGIYFQAADAKTRIDEWRDGTAVYYWFSDPWLGLPQWLSTFVRPALTHGFFVTALSWGAVALEFVLFAGLLMERRYRPWLLVAGMLFHFGIAVAHGLVTFAIAMWAALLLFLWPIDSPVTANALIRFYRTLFLKVGGLSDRRASQLS